MSPEQIEAAVFPPAVLHPQTSLLCLENTHNAAGGVCLSVEQTKSLADAARSHGLRIHMDGARIFNSVVGQSVSPADLTREVDSVTVCLTKGLGCPVGALVLGGANFVADARRWRQAVGGGCGKQVSLLPPGSWLWTPWWIDWPRTMPTHGVWPLTWLMPD